MYSSRSLHRSRSSEVRPLVVFLLVASFGILFAGCKGPDQTAQQDDIFTAEDLAKRDMLATQSGAELTGTGATPYLAPLTGSGETAETGPVLDIGLAKTYEAIRATPATQQGNLFRVTNDFVNMRATPDSSGKFVRKVNGGEVMEVESFPNASWAKVRLVADKQEGFVSSHYIGKLVTDDQLAGEKKLYDGQYFVNYAYVNVRATPDNKGTKLGQIDGQTIVKPLDIKGDWAHVSFEGKDGYVSAKYLAPFLPQFIVRQDNFTLPILHYDLTQQGTLQLMGTHLQSLSDAGMKVLTMQDFYNILLKQEQYDATLPKNAVVLTISGVTGQNAADVSSTLLSAGISATLFIETKNVGIDGITEKMATTMVANGFDLESAGHTGDDLRALTNAQLDLEMKQSRKLLEDLTGRQVFAIEYPRSLLNDRVLQAAANDGYLMGVVDLPGKTFGREDLLKLPSYTVTPSMTGDDVVKLIRP